jgi:hypothetical protein
MTRGHPLSMRAFEDARPRASIHAPASYVTRDNFISHYSDNLRVMASIESLISTGSDTFQANRDGMLQLLARVRAYEQRAIAASESSRGRFEKRGQLLPRERVALLLDAGSPFLELCTLAGFGLDHADLTKSVPGGGVDPR